MIYVFYEKHENRYIQGDVLQNICAFVLKRRLKEGYWYDEEESKKALLAIENQQADIFMLKRRSYEYEDFEKIYVEEVN